MINQLLARFKTDPERKKYDTWVKAFSDRIFECTRSNEAVKAELECWPFEPDEIMYNWRESDPVDAADEAMIYYGD